MAGEVAPYLDGIPVVADAATREIRFPLATRSQDQRVFNKGTGSVERWSGSAWLVDFLGSSNVLAFGAKGDGTTDDTAAIQAALTALAGKTVTFPPGTYLCYAVKVFANTTVDLGSATILKRPAIVSDQTVAAFTGNGTVFFVAGYAPLFYVAGNAVVITGGTIDGNRTNDTLATGATWGGSFAGIANRAGIVASTNAVPACKDLTVRNVRFQNMLGCAIDTDLTGTIRLEGNTETNAKHLFTFAGGDGTTSLVNGSLFLTDNSLAGDRSQDNVGNPFVIDRRQQVVVSGNIIDERLSVTGAGCKIQESPSVTVTGNVLIDSFLKPQSSAGFYGDSFVIADNTFSTSQPASHQCGIVFGSHRMKSLVISGNAFTNGTIIVERSCDAINITGNTMRYTLDARPTGTPAYFAIWGGANQNGGVAGTELISGNLIDCGGQAAHNFYQASSSLAGDTEIRDNWVSGADSLFSVMLSGDSSAGRLRIVGNTFKFFRAIGRFDLQGIAELLVKGNTWSGINIAAVTSLNSTTQREMRLTLNAGTYTYIGFEGNTVNAREIDFYFATLGLGALTLGTLALLNNVLNNYDSAGTGASFVQTGAGTITTLLIKNNVVVGDINVTGTHTTELVEGNTFIITSPQRRVNGIGYRPTIPEMRAYSPTLTPASVAAATTVERTYAVTGLVTTDTVLVGGPPPTAGTGIVNARVSGADTLALTHINTTAGALVPAAGTYLIIAIRQ